MRQRSVKRAIAHRLASSVGRLSSSINPDRIKAIQSRMMTPNYTHEGKGHSSRVERVAVNTPDGFMAMDIHRITTPTTIHSKGPTGFYRGRYR